MTVTLTIKNVPDDVAEALRQRARAGHRSLQRELLLVATEAAARPASRVAEPAAPVYVALPPSGKARGRPVRQVTPGRLSLDQLWQRARALGTGNPSESAAIVRADRDARDRR